MPFVKRQKWEDVYKNQNQILSSLGGVDKIFLGGGTAIQRFHSSSQYRESDDLDFFLPSYDSQAYLSAAISIKKELENSGIKIENVVNDYGVYRFICKVPANEERVKVELLNCTAERFGKSYVKDALFQRIENKYDLILYKLKALHDRQDTIKDLFDLYFLFKENKNLISQKKLFMDLRMKFEASTGYIYNEKHVIEALSAKYRKWDIVLRDIEGIEKTWIESAIEEFRIEFLSQILDANLQHFELRFEDTKKRDTLISLDDYYEYVEINPFITHAYSSFKDKDNEVVAQQVCSLLKKNSDEELL